MTAKELTEWQAFYQYVEPFGGKFWDMQFASLRLQNYRGKERLGIDDMLLYDYNMQTDEQKQVERLKKAKNQAAALYDFLATKVKSK